jgi:hypothetical protein
MAVVAVRSHIYVSCPWVHRSSHGAATATLDWFFPDTSALKHMEEAEPEREGAVLPGSFQLRLSVNDDVGDVWQLLA